MRPAARRASLVLVAVVLGLAIAWVDTRPGWDDTGITAFALAGAAGLVTLLGLKWWLAAALRSAIRPTAAVRAGSTPMPTRGCSSPVAVVWRWNRCLFRHSRVWSNCPGRRHRWFPLPKWPNCCPHIRTHLTHNLC
jgi:hypothetical protein